jgi:IS66 C-terminal element
MIQRLPLRHIWESSGICLGPVPDEFTARRGRPLTGGRFWWSNDSNWPGRAAGGRHRRSLGHRLVRPIVVGRKGWLFSDTVKGAVASANLFSIVEPAKANGVEPHAYLMRLFSRLPNARTVEDFETLLPWNVKATLTPARSISITVQLEVDEVERVGVTSLFRKQGFVFYPLTPEEA